jgi:TetR/AcrR family transcriptional regulator, repressor for neighboring sulfatase
MATSVKRPTGRDEILDAVLDAAERLFAAAGPADVSLRAIAQEAGVNYGLVHRHFGTKDELFDQLLLRYQQRWTVRLEGDELDYAGALEQMLGTGRDAGTYLRLLAWTLLSDRGEPSDPHRQHAALDRLPARRGGPVDEATRATAAGLAFAFGWRFFNPFIRSALHLDEADDAALTEQMRKVLHGIVDPPR